MFGALLAVFVAGGQALMAAGASSPVPPPPSGKARSITVEQSGAASAGRALRLGSGQKLVVKDVIHDTHGSTTVSLRPELSGSARHRWRPGEPP